MARFRSSATTARALCSNAHGTVMVEYVIVLALVSVGASLAVISLGSLLLRLFQYQQAILLLPFP